MMPQRLIVRFDQQIAAETEGKSLDPDAYVEKSNERAQATYRTLGMDGGTPPVMEAML